MVFMDLIKELFTDVKGELEMILRSGSLSDAYFVGLSIGSELKEIRKNSDSFYRDYVAALRDLKEYLKNAGTGI